MSLARSLPLLTANIDVGAVMQSFRRIVLETGIAGGLLFTIHASIPYCGAWPILWPALAGATAFWLATRAPHPRRLGTGLGVALAAAVMTGVVAFVGVSTVIYVAVHTAPSLRHIGAPGGLITAASIAAAAHLGAIVLVVAFLAGALMLPVRYFQGRRAHA